MEQFADTTEVLAPDADLLNDKRYTASIESIARELAVPVEDVLARFKATLATLAPRATVSDYIAILVEKKVKALYRTNYRHVAAPRYVA